MVGLMVDTASCCESLHCGGTLECPDETGISGQGGEAIQQIPCKT